MKTLAGFAAAIAVAAPMGAAQAQAVYKCNDHSYSQAPCSTRIVRTYDAPVELPRAKPHDVIAHRLPGESADELAVRKHRVNLSESDRQECARLDKKIPFDEQRLKTSAWQEEIDQAQDSLSESRKRFKQLRC